MAMTKLAARRRRKRRIRVKVAGTSERPRLTIFRSNKHIYAQVVDDGGAKALVAVSDRGKGGQGLDGKNKVDRARSVGEALAEACRAKGINQVVFDRNGYKYHGRVSALAEGARKGGLDF